MTTKAEIEHKPLEYYLGLNYPITITPDITGGFVAEIEDLPGCFTQGESLTEILDNLEESLHLWLESAYEDGLDIPLPRSEDKYSGKFNVRFPKSLHRKLNKLADREGVSLNQFLVSTLSHALGFEEGRQSKKHKTKIVK
ncbi:type II toxin-antitoxin system HicB family antitoxin [Chloroflexota bacterium]